MPSRLSAPPTPPHLYLTLISIKKIRDTKGTFHAKMSTIKDTNGMDLTEAEDIKNRWQKYPEEVYKKGLNDSDNHNGVITHLEPDILECKLIWNICTALHRGVKM